MFGALFPMLVSPNLYHQRLKARPYCGWNFGERTGVGRLSNLSYLISHYI